VGHGDDHRGRSRSTARSRLQRLSAHFCRARFGETWPAGVETPWSSGRHVRVVITEVSSILGFYACWPGLPEPFTEVAQDRWPSAVGHYCRGDLLLLVAAVFGNFGLPARGTGKDNFPDGRGRGSEHPSQPASASLSGTAATKIASKRERAEQRGTAKDLRSLKPWELQTLPER
jgi:hypothetical protein